MYSRQVMALHLIPGAASVISIFGIELLSGAAGGLLLGATAVVMIQALELLLEDKFLMEQLEKYIVDSYYFAIKIEVNGLQISLFSGIFGVFSSALSFTFGLYLGLSTYSLVIYISICSALWYCFHPSCHIANIFFNILL